MASKKRVIVKKTDKSLQNKEIEIHYLKTPAYRSYHVDGVFGGVTGKGKLYCELFIDRSATPQKVLHEVLPDNRVGNEICREGKKGLVREIECGMILDVNTAIAMRDWLSRRIDEINKVFTTVSKEKK